MRTNTSPESGTPVFVPCGRCGGRGTIDYGRVFLARQDENGVHEDRYCFECGGAKGRWSTVQEEAKRTARNEKARVRREAKKLAQREANAATFAAQCDATPGLAEALAIQEHGILADLRNKGTQYGVLSDKQIELALRIAAEDFEAELVKDATPEPVVVPVPEGRMEVTGTLRSARFVDGPVYGSGSWKGLVQDDRGFKVWGTIPRSIDPAIGDRITFTATLTRSNDDEAFGFYSRPTKAAIVDGE